MYSKKELQRVGFIEYREGGRLYAVAEIKHLYARDSLKVERRLKGLEGSARAKVLSDLLQKYAY